MFCTEIITMPHFCWLDLAEQYWHALHNVEIYWAKLSINNETEGCYKPTCTTATFTHCSPGKAHDNARRSITCTTATFTHCSPGKAHDNARRSIFVQSIGCEYRFANKVGEVVTGDCDTVRLTLHQLVRRFPKYLQHICYLLATGG